MVNVFDSNQGEFVKKLAKELKNLKEIQKPEYAKYVKTGVNKERPPVDNDWWYMRAASILRKFYNQSRPVGVSRLRKAYGGKKNRGHKPERKYKASGAIIRKILQQLEKEGLIKFTETGVHKGRVITPKGKSFLDKVNKLN